MTNVGGLDLFCAWIVKKYGSPELAFEEDKAAEFRDIYLKGLPVSLKALRAAAFSCGINLKGWNMPSKLRGYNEVFDNNMNAYYKEDDCQSGIQNTILHEIREIMEHRFALVCPSYRPLRTIALHLAANRFAAAVLLPREYFEEKLYETGCDVVALAQSYLKSHSQVLIRIGEVLQGKMFFYGALYESKGAIEPELVVTYWTCSWNGESDEQSFYVSPHFFPRRGQTVVAGSLVDQVRNYETPFLVERIVTSEVADNDLTAIAQPVMRGGCLDRVVLVVLLRQDMELLQPQIERLKPVVMDDFVEHL